MIFFIMFVYEDGGLIFCLMSLWVFFVCMVNGWEVMLGGFVCIGKLLDLIVIGM